MSYSKDNKNFIHQNLVLEMRGLPNADKLAKYELKKEDNRKRLAKSYLICGNDKEKLEFYNEAFSINSFFESDFLMLNLFFESQSANYFTSLTDNNCFDNLNFQNTTELPFKFWNYMKSPLSKKMEGFLKQEIIFLIDEITDMKWCEESEKTNFIVRKYAEWLITNFKNPTCLNQVLYSVQLFCKIWNSVPHFIKFNNLKAIIFVKELNRHFDDLKNNNQYLDLEKYFNLICDEFKILLTNELKYCPLIDEKNFDLYSTQYNSEIENFKNRIDFFKKINISFVDLTYLAIFKQLCDTIDLALINKINSDLKQKINNFEIPTKDELKFIENLESNQDINKIKFEFYRNQYLYEKLDYI